MKTWVFGIGIFARAIITWHKFRHTGASSIKRKGAQYAKARSAFRTGDKWIKVTAICRCNYFLYAAATWGDIAWNLGCSGTLALTGLDAKSQFSLWSYTLAVQAVHLDWGWGVA
jgi:hypothetical protein